MDLARFAMEQHSVLMHREKVCWSSKRNEISKVRSRGVGIRPARNPRKDKCGRELFRDDHEDAEKSRTWYRATRCVRRNCASTPPSSSCQ